MSADPRQITATEIWSPWEGKVVNGVFPLRRFLGGSSRSGVFLSEQTADNRPNVAIKFVPADAVQAEAQLVQWGMTTTLSHPNLVRIFDVGRYRFDGRDYLFVVTEYADQTLAEILPRRPLDAEEVRELLLPTLDTLLFLHRKGLIHGRLKPTNFLAVDDRLKLSSDTIRPINHVAAGTARTSAYDPPELLDRGRNAAGDIWGLGMTLLEALTQHTTAWPDETVSLPANLPAPFANTVMRCLSVAPAIRPTVLDLDAQYRPAPSPAPAAPPAAKPTVREAAPPAPAAKPTVREAAPPAPAAKPTVREAAPSAPAAKPTAREAAPPAPPAKPTVREAAPPAPAAKPTVLEAAPLAPAAKPTVLETAPPPPKATPKPRAPKQKSWLPKFAIAFVLTLAAWMGVHLVLIKQQAPSQPAAVPAPAPTPPPVATKPEPATPAPAKTSAKDVLKEVMPVVAQEAQQKIRGRLNVTVRVLVGPDGNVVGTMMENPGASKYFAQLAEQAAADWQFVPAADQKQRVWLVRFIFTRNGVSARPVEQ